MARATAEPVSKKIRSAAKGASTSKALNMADQAVGDWRDQLRKAPGVLFGVALGGGVLLALLTRGHKQAAAQPPPPGWNATLQRPDVAGPLAHTLSAAIRGAIFAVAASQAQTFLTTLLGAFGRSATHGSKAHSK